MDYIGTELELFAAAQNWKTYFASALAPYIGARVAEVGAGIGSTTRALCDPALCTSWMCIEPDAKMAAALSQQSNSGQLRTCCQVHCGVLADLPAAGQFDTILYIDVLEHIEHDETELRVAAERLAPGGRIIVLAPAWPHLFSDFDRSIGHFRRYTKAGLSQLKVEGMRLETSFYLDAMGYFASLANRAFLRQSMPTIEQVKFWDTYLVPVSRKIDGPTFHVIGKTVIAIWRTARH